MKIIAILPVLNEAERIESVLASLMNQEGVEEILVADGGSHDDTAERARRFSRVRVVEAPRGRARQMNHAAAQASGDVFWFLHADVRVSEGSGAAIQNAIRGGAEAGAFRFAPDSNRPALRILAWGVRIRSEILGIPYGDQGIFVTREAFEAVGGYGDLPKMEDLYLVRRLRKRRRLALLSLPIRISARRWEREGILRTTLRHWGWVIADRLGRGDAHRVGSEHKEVAASRSGPRAPRSSDPESRGDRSRAGPGTEPCSKTEIVT